MTGNGKFIAPINKSDDWGMVQMALFYQQLITHVFWVPSPFFHIHGAGKLAPTPPCMAKL